MLEGFMAIALQHPRRADGKAVGGSEGR